MHRNDSHWEANYTKICRFFFVCVCVCMLRSVFQLVDIKIVQAMWGVEWALLWMCHGISTISCQIGLWALCALLYYGQGPHDAAEKHAPRCNLLWEEELMRDAGGGCGCAKLANSSEQSSKGPGEHNRCFRRRSYNKPKLLVSEFIICSSSHWVSTHHSPSVAWSLPAEPLSL